LTPQEFINQILPAAIDNYKRYGVLPSLTIAQAAHESGWGDSSLARGSNNLFGIKGIGTAGSVNLPTEEEVNGKNVKVMADFRAYHNQVESIDDYGKLLTNSRYKNVLTAPNYKAAAFSVYNAGYATDSNYPGKIIGVIEDNKLYQYDEQVKGVPRGTYTPPASSQQKTSSSTTPQASTLADSGQSFGGAWNPANWIDFAKDLVFKAAFFIPAMILLVLGIYFLFSEQINTAVKAVATDGLSLAAEKGGN